VLLSLFSFFLFDQFLPPLSTHGFWALSLSLAVGFCLTLLYSLSPECKRSGSATLQQHLMARVKKLLLVCFAATLTCFAIATAGLFMWGVSRACKK